MLRELKWDLLASSLSSLFLGMLCVCVCKVLCNCMLHCECEQVLKTKQNKIFTYFSTVNPLIARMPDGSQVFFPNCILTALYLINLQKDVV